MSSSSLLAFTFLALLGHAPALRAQTCGGALSCTTSPTAYGVFNSGAGVALEGSSSYTGTSPAQGIYGSEANGAVGSAGVFGIASGCDPKNVGLGPAGVIGAGSSTGVIGYASIAASGSTGVAGYVQNNQFGCTTGSLAAGYLGYRSGTSNYGVYSVGNTGATGTKSFLEPHPTDPTKEIRFVSLEGPEAGTYFRGSGRTVHGTATIEVPESFRLVTAKEGLTVVVTPVGELAQVAAISKSLDRIVIRSSQDVEFDFVVNGVRRAFQDFQPIADNDDFVPTGPDDNRFTAYPAETQRRLVATGIYRPDGSVNVEKAHEMGWDARWAPAQPGSGSAEGFLRDLNRR